MAIPLSSPIASSSGISGLLTRGSSSKQRLRSLSNSMDGMIQDTVNQPLSRLVCPKCEDNNPTNFWYRSMSLDE